MNLTAQLSILILGFLCIRMFLLKLRYPLQGIKILMSAAVVSMLFKIAETVKSEPFIVDHKVFLAATFLVATIFILIRWYRNLVFRLMGLGTLTNVLAFIANNWMMPVFMGWDAYNNQTPESIGPLHSVMTKGSHLVFFGDWFSFKLEPMDTGPFNFICSPGDILIAAGIFMGVYKILTKHVAKMMQTKNG